MEQVVRSVFSCRVPDFCCRKNIEEYSFKHVQSVVFLFWHWRRTRVSEEGQRARASQRARERERMILKKVARYTISNRARARPSSPRRLFQLNQDPSQFHSESPLGWDKIFKEKEGRNVEKKTTRSVRFVLTNLEIQNRRARAQNSTHRWTNIKQTWFSIVSFWIFHFLYCSTIGYRDCC